MRLIKRQRTKGWRIAQVAADLGISPDDIVYIGRGSMWANPYDWRVYGKKTATLLYSDLINGKPWNRFFHREGYLIRQNAPTLLGKVFMGWCADWNGEEPAPDCHGVPLWRFVNEVTA